MADTTDNGYIEFLEFHLPILQSGQYQVEITQTVNAAKTKEITGSTEGNSINEEFPSKTAQFYVAGDRVTIPPQKIHSVFPPTGSLGDHSMVLPHIIFTTSTLPWQRNYRNLDEQEMKAFDSQVEALKEKVKANETLSTAETVLLRKLSIPWMALLLFHEGELQDQSVRGPQVVQRKNIATGNDFSFNSPKAEPGESPEDKMTVIDVKMSLLGTLLPKEEDLEFLSHVRLIKATVTDPGTELAVIMGNRLPQENGSSTVHLVSMEQQFGSDGKFLYSDKEYVRLISLKSWSFSCIDPKQGFEGLLTNLNGYKPKSEGEKGTVFTGTNPADNYTLRIPSNSTNEAVKKYFDAGFVALPHTFRDGSSSISWYHGPFISGSSPLKKDTFPLPILDSDQLLVYSQSQGMFEVSYAAAWELGRLLALQSKDFSYSLYNWKRQHCQKINIAAQSQQLSHLPQAGEKPSFTIPAHITSWLNDLNLLKGLPFNYLVPDERMLPLESIRFFQIDPVWIECLLDGAFSIGRVNEAERTRDGGHEESPAQNNFPGMSGFLMRSDIVSGWPALQVDGLPSDGSSTAKIKPLRMERLSQNTLLCLFNQKIKAVGFHVKPEALHYGFTFNGNSGNKTPRAIDGSLIDSSFPIVPNDNEQRIISISEVVADLQQPKIFSKLGFTPPFTSAQFALCLSETGDEVWFNIKSA